MILTVCGGKGGVGKSSVALALGHVLDATVVDADVGMPDLPADAGATLQDVATGRADPATAIRDDWAVAVVPAERSLAGARAASPTEIGDALQRLADHAGPLVVDGPAGLGTDAAVPMAIADACVLVTTPETAAIADAVRTRAAATEYGAGTGVVVLNRVRDRRPSVEKRLGGPVVEVGESEALASATAAGLPVTVSAPTSAAAEQVRRVGERLRRVTHRPRSGW